MRLQLYTLAALFLLISSCISVSIKMEGTYGALSAEQKSHIKKFAAGEPLHDTSHVFTLYELMPDQLRKQATMAEYTCYFSQVPHCHGPHCKPLPYYTKLLASLDSLHAQTFLVSPYYEYNILQKEKEQFYYSGLLFVEDKNCYGSHKFNSHKLFIEQLLGHTVKGRDTLCYASYYIFHRDTLVSYGLEQLNAVQYIREHKR